MILLLLSLVSGLALAAAPHDTSDWRCRLNQKIPAFESCNERIENRLNELVPIEEVQTDASDEFYFLCKKMRVACGEELLSSDPFLSADDVYRPYRLTVRKFLDTLIARHPNYFWEIDDGVLLIRPRTHGRWTPLDKRIAQYSSKDKNFGFVVDDLASSEWIHRNSYITVGPDEDPDRTWKSGVKPIDVTCKDKTVREILVSAARAHGNSIWIYRQAPPIRYVPDFFRRGNIDAFTY